MNGFPVVALSDCQLDSSAERVEVRLSGWSRPGIQCDDFAVRFLHLKNKRPRFARLPQSIRSSCFFPELSKKKKKPQKSVLPFAYRLISSLTSCFFSLSLFVLFSKPRSPRLDGRLLITHQAPQHANIKSRADYDSVDLLVSP